MSEPVNPLVIDLSHWDPAKDYAAVKANGIVAVIYKATEGQNYQDPTYVSQQHAAKAAGLRWGAYHFADGSDVDGQAANFMSFACPDPDEVFVLDWEDNPSGAGKMSMQQAKDWISLVETALNRPGECVIYGGNTLKEMIKDDSDNFFGSRRLWLCQYSSTPTVPDAWDEYWLWQYTDGAYGPKPQSIDGVGACDINSYDGTEQELLSDWTYGPVPDPPNPPDPEPEVSVVDVNISAPPNVKVNVNVSGGASEGELSHPPMSEEEKNHWKSVKAARRASHVDQK